MNPALPEIITNNTGGIGVCKKGRAG